jgi:phosphoribosyl 1,2-cyclic phosphodiesterase
LDAWRLRLRFWGVRGSTPTPLASHLVHGGNTSCLEVRLPDGGLFLFDAGSGARPLGLSLMEEFDSLPLSLNLFLTHFHWDHIHGLPFFAPLYREGVTARFHSSSPQLRHILRGQMAPPYFPVPFETMLANPEFALLDTQSVAFGPLRIYPFALCHPQGATGYRIEADGAAIVYATDHEHGDPRTDRILRDFAQGADLLIYDAQYTPEEHQRFRGWGHSTYLAAAETARDAGVKQLVLFHHDPSHDDDAMRKLTSSARQHFESTVAAAEGWTVEL